MLKKEINTIICFLLVLSFLSCNGQLNQNPKLDFRYKEYISDNFYSYEHIRSQINDTLLNWKEKKLKIGGGNFQIDSILIFNTDSSQLRTTLNKKTMHQDGLLDAIQAFNGRKINGKWYFYQGGTHYFPHDNHQDSTYANYSFDELGYLSYKYILRGFLKFNEDGTYYINQKAFERYRTPFGPEPDLTELEKDSLIIATLKASHKKTISDKEYKDIEESIRNSVRPPEPPRDPKDKEIRLFESEAWKNRYKTK